MALTEEKGRGRGNQFQLSMKMNHAQFQDSAAYLITD